LFGLVPMALFGAISVIALRAGDGRSSGLIGLVSGVSSAPGLLAAGAPLGDEGRYPLAIVASIPLWLVLGWIASRRATKRSLASWRDYSRELIWLVIGVVMGAIAALVTATAVLGESLVF
jgi:peptidoglycan biosynthesis protein MviN/MurJ (putative lipid II flippase)